jgi:hypothetical protein
MQTFLPYSSFVESARALDPKRLGNQAYRECKTLLSGGWPNHPAAKMWKGYEWQLCVYMHDCLLQLKVRGYYYPHHIAWVREKAVEFEITNPPAWLGDERLHSSHRAVLLAKDPTWYGQFGWKEAPATKEKGKPWPYYWPL